MVGRQFGSWELRPQECCSESDNRRISLQGRVKLVQLAPRPAYVNSDVFRWSNANR